MPTPQIRKEVWQHIFENASKKGIVIDTVNGYEDHCHCLVSLGAKQMISNIMRLIKGESSHWINKNNVCRQNFEWQDEYYAVSVCPARVASVRDYIRRQEAHHARQSFQNEMDTYLMKWGFERIKDD